MAFKSLATSGIVNFNKYQNALVGNVAYVPDDFELISTTRLTASQASVNFDTSSLVGSYKHLQIRMLSRTDRVNYNATIGARFNSDTSSSYSYHELYGTGSGVSSAASPDSSYAFAGNATGSSAASTLFTPSILDIFDFANTSKYKTTKNLTGVHTGNTQYIEFMSSNWRNTAAITSIDLFAANASNILSGSRFSLYGIRG